MRCTGRIRHWLPLLLVIPPLAAQQDSTTVHAGTGTAGDSRADGPATKAALNGQDGNAAYLLRPDAQAPSLLVSPNTMSFKFQRGGSVPPLQTLSVASSGSPLDFSTSAKTASGGNWLAVTPAAGKTPATLSVSINTSGLADGAYSGTVTINSPSAANTSTSVTVTLTVTSVAPGPTVIVGLSMMTRALPASCDFTKPPTPATNLLTTDKEAFLWFTLTGADPKDTADGEFLDPAGLSYGKVSWGAAPVSRS